MPGTRPTPTSRQRPFAVNQIVHKSNSRLEHDLELAVRYKVPIVITSLGARTDLNDAVHSYGGMVLHDVINQRFARKAIEKGADGLILVAAGAGGHAGVQSPFALVQETRRWFDGPIALSGAIATGRAVLAAEAMGADFAYVGSAFIATREANASEAYKQALVDGTAEDIVYSSLFTGVHGNYLRRLDRRRRPRSRQPARRRPEQDELRQRRQQGGQGVEGHLGQRAGNRGDRRHPGGGAAGGAAGGGVSGGEAGAAGGRLRIHGRPRAGLKASVTGRASTWKPLLFQARRRQATHSCRIGVTTALRCGANSAGGCVPMGRRIRLEESMGDTYRATASAARWRSRPPARRLPWATAIAPHAGIGLPARQRLHAVAAGRCR